MASHFKRIEEAYAENPQNPMNPDILRPKWRGDRKDRHALASWYDMKNEELHGYLCHMARYVANSRRVLAGDPDDTERQWRTF